VLTGDPADVGKALGADLGRWPLMILWLISARHVPTMAERTSSAVSGSLANAGGGSVSQASSAPGCSSRPSRPLIVDQPLAGREVQPAVIVGAGAKVNGNSSRCRFVSAPEIVQLPARPKSGNPAHGSE